MDIKGHKELKHAEKENAKEEILQTDKSVTCTILTDKVKASTLENILLKTHALQKCI